MKLHHNDYHNKYKSKFPIRVKSLLRGFTEKYSHAFLSFGTIF